VVNGWLDGGWWLDEWIGHWMFGWMGELISWWVVGWATPASFPAYLTQSSSCLILYSLFI
jgi:hypothetical protein